MDGNTGHFGRHGKPKMIIPVQTKACRAVDVAPVLRNGWLFTVINHGQRRGGAVGRERGREKE